MASNNITSAYLIALQNRPSSIVRLCTNTVAMAVNDNNNSLLYCPGDNFVLIDEQQNKMLNIPKKFKVSDMCYSSFLNQFLIFAYKPEYALYFLDSSTHNLQKIKEFNRTIWSCTCYDKTLIVSEAENGSRVEVYDLGGGQWNPIQTFTAPYSCATDHQIERIRLNSDGSRLGMILRQGSKPNYHHWFELRDPTNMSVIMKTDIHPNDDIWCWLLALPNQQFLAILQRHKTFFLFGSNGKLEETALCDEKIYRLNSIALVNDRYIAVQTGQPDELRCYDLQR